MKIYIPNLNIGHLSNLDLDDLKKKIEHIEYIYSDEGIFQLKNNQIIKAHIQDEPVIKHEINNIICLVDKSKIIYNTKQYVIPFHHIKNKIIKTTYTIHKHLDLVTQTGDLSHDDIYFNTYETNDIILTEIISFLLNKVNLNI